VVLGLDVVFHTGEDAELSFDGDVVAVGECDHLLRESGILLIGMVRSVDHDGGKAAFDAGNAEVVRIPVVQVQDDGDLADLHFARLAPHHLHGPLAEVLQKRPVGVIPRPLGDLEDHRRLRLQAGHDDGLKLLHVVEIVGRNGIAAINGIGKHLAGVYQT